MGCIVSEPGDVLDKPKIRDLFKRGVEFKVCREKMNTNGEHIRIPAYNNHIWASNDYLPREAGFIKRIDLIEFNKNERMTEKDEESFSEEFHHVSWENTPFKKLKKIGEYIIWYTYHNMGVLDLNHKDMIDEWLNELFKYSGHSVIDEWFLTYKCLTLEDVDDGILDDLRSMILNDYTHKVPYHKTTPPSDEDLLPTFMADNTFRDNILSLIQNNMIPYLFINKDRENRVFIGFRTGTGKALEKFTNNHVQYSGKRLASLFNKEYGNISVANTNGKPVKGFKLSEDEFIQFLS